MMHVKCYSYTLLFMILLFQSAYASDYSILSTDTMLKVQSDTVRGVEVIKSQSNDVYYLSITFSDEQAAFFKRMTGDNVRKRLGVIDQDKLIGFFNITGEMAVKTQSIPIAEPSRSEHPMLGTDGVVIFFIEGEQVLLSQTVEAMTQSDNTVFVPWTDGLTSSRCADGHHFLLKDQDLISTNWLCTDKGMTFTKAGI